MLIGLLLLAMFRSVWSCRLEYVWLYSADPQRRLRAGLLLFGFVDSAHVLPTPDQQQPADDAK